MDICSRQAAALTREATLQAHCWEGSGGLHHGAVEGEGHKRRLSPAFVRGPLQ